MIWPFNKLKELKDLRVSIELKQETINEQRLIINEIKKSYEQLKEKLNNEESYSTLAVKELLNSEITWYNYNELPESSRKAYFENSKALLSNEVFVNEYNHYLADIIKHTASEAKNWEQYCAMREGICFLETLKERFMEIARPDSPKKPTDVNSAI